MNIDVPAAISFVATHGRVLERRRLERLLVDRTDPAGVLAALDGYRNPDGGYGWGIEPDLRAPESQPVGAMHALEVLAEVAPTTTPRSVELCDWLGAHSLADGGLPFALPIADPAGCAALWTDPDATSSSLQITAQVAANAHHVARHDPAVARHPWLARATAWCLADIARRDALPAAYELLFTIRFLDAVADVDPDAAALLDRFGSWLPADGVVPVEGGAAGEALRPLDLAPRPGPAQRRFPDDLVARERERLAHEQQPDGGWTVTFASASPAAELEWRAYATVAAVTILRDDATNAPP